MKTLIVKQEKEVKYTEEYSKPAPGEREVLLKVRCNGICATDMAIFNGTAGFMHDGSTKWPVRFGHEFAGEVVEIGEGVHGFRPGDKAISVGYVACLHCEACREHRYEECPGLRSVGTINTYPGSFAEYVCFPEEFLIRIPEDFSYEQIALIEPCAVAMDAVNQAGIIKGKSTVLVIGTGPIGIAAAVLSKRAGAAKVMIAGRTDWKLEIAKSLGCDQTINTRTGNLRELVLESTGGCGADRIIECSGNVEVLNDCVEALSHSGTLAVVAFYEQPWKNFNIDRFVMKNCSMVPVMYHDFQGVIQAMSEGVDFTPLITKRISFDDCADYFNSTLNREGSNPDIKVMVYFDTPTEQ